MKHAVLGAGAVGGLIATMLADAGDEVTAIVRDAPPDGRARRYELEIAGRPPIAAQVGEIAALEPDTAVDVLWITTKSQALGSALERVRGSSPRAVVPLLNGFEHIAVLQEAFGTERVIPATIAVEAERSAPGRFRQVSPFNRMAFDERGRTLLAATAGALMRRGVEVAFDPDATSVLWRKLLFLGPFALVTSASGLRAGGVRDDERWRRAYEGLVEEAARVARASGATVDAGAPLAMLDRMPPEMTTSMHKDVQADREPELDGIAGAVIRRAASLGIPVPLFSRFAQLVKQRSSRVIRTADAPQPIGPYVQAVNTGGFVFFSGQIALDPQTGSLVGDDAAVQTERALQNLGAVLKAAGLGFADVVKTTLYLANMGDYASVNDVYAKYFNSDPPARSTVAVSALPRGSLVEIDAIAFRRA